MSTLKLILSTLPQGISLFCLLDHKPTDHEIENLLGLRYLLDEHPDTYFLDHNWRTWDDTLNTVVECCKSDYFLLWDCNINEEFTLPKFETLSSEVDILFRQDPQLMNLPNGSFSWGELGNHYSVLWKIVQQIHRIVFRTEFIREQKVQFSSDGWDPMTKFARLAYIKAKCIGVVADSSLNDDQRGCLPFLRSKLDFLGLFRCLCDEANELNQVSHGHGLSFVYDDFLPQMLEEFSLLGREKQCHLLPQLRTVIGYLSPSLLRPIDQKRLIFQYQLYLILLLSAKPRTVLKSQIFKFRLLKLIGTPKKRRELKQLIRQCRMLLEYCD